MRNWWKKLKPDLVPILFKKRTFLSRVSEIGNSCCDVVNLAPLIYTYHRQRHCYWLEARTQVSCVDDRIQVQESRDEKRKQTTNRQKREKALQSSLGETEIRN